MSGGSVHRRGRRGWRATRKALLAALLVLACLLLTPTALLASPVEWREVPATAAGRQWWDGGSLRINRSGSLSVLSRFLPAAGPEAGAAGRRPAASLYVMEIDCSQGIFRDTSVNGLPRFGAAWQQAAGDPLISAVLQAACAAAADRLATASP